MKMKKISKYDIQEAMRVIPYIFCILAGCYIQYNWKVYVVIWGAICNFFMWPVPILYVLISIVVLAILFCLFCFLAVD